MAILAGSALAGTRWWHRSRPFPVAVEGDSMAPTLAAGDYLVAIAAGPGMVRRGQLVVVAHPDRPDYELIKRVAGVPGDTIGEADSRMLRAGEFWVLGEDPSKSTDSRSFGPVTHRAIRGVVRLRYWPLSRAGPVP
jgi:nickel-type superoxide dismutase maturation protease